MEIRVLRYFLAVAREENISKAAEFVHTTQPNLSRQMQNLEEEIGKPLFVRGNRKIALTEAGALLRKRAEEIIDLYDKTEADLAGDDEEICGDIHIGCGESYAMRLIAKAAKHTQEMYPKIKFHFFSGDAGVVTERLDKGLFDFGVLINYDDLARYDYIRFPLTDVWGVLMRKDCPLADKSAVTVEDLRGFPIIFPQQAAANRGHLLANWFQQIEVEPDIVVTYNLIYNASLLVEEGLGVAVGLDRLINTSGDSELCFRPLSPRLESHLDIAWKKYQVFPRAAEIFIANLRKIL